MGEAKPLVYVVVETQTVERGERRVKAVFKSRDEAQKAIEQEFHDYGFTYEIVPRTLHESITD